MDWTLVGATVRLLESIKLIAVLPEIAGLIVYSSLQSRPFGAALVCRVCAIAQEVTPARRTCQQCSGRAGTV